MTIDEIKEQIITALANDCDEHWFSILDNTSPGHYGVEDISFRLDAKNLWADVLARRFAFQNGTLAFRARLGASREEDAIDVNHSQGVSGLGRFAWDGVQGISVDELEINEHIDLLERSTEPD